MRKNRYLNTLFAISLAVISVGSRASSGPVVSTDAGKVEGASRQGMDVWEGIPFAEPPTGALRWQSPQPVAHREKTLKTTSPASACAQNAVLGVFAEAGGSEDCLYLNVYRSSDTKDPQQKRPVFVWIYGGTLQVGQADHYNPAKLVKQGNAVVVTLNYRVGVLGFFAQPALNGKDRDYANYGLMDQQAALRWVKTNIAAFGGDPDNVTIAGESAGGDSVMANIISPAAAGLFQHAIVMSGGTLVTRWPAYGGSIPMDVAVNAGNGFTKAAGCSQDDAECLRSLTTEQILKIQNTFAFNQVIVDGKVLPEHPADALREGRFNKVTVINGGNHDEGTLFPALTELATGKSMTDENYPEALKGIVGEKLLAAVLKEYPLDAYPTPSEAFAAAAGDSLFSCPSRKVNHLLAGKVPLYAYEFSDQTAPLYTGPLTFPLKSAHTSELAYLFPGFHGGADKAVVLNPLQEKLSDKMVGYFARISGLTANGKAWPQYDPAKDNYMTFSLPEGRVLAGRFNREHHCDFWENAGIF